MESEFHGGTFHWTATVVADRKLYRSSTPGPKCIQDCSRHDATPHSLFETFHPAQDSKQKESLLEWCCVGFDVSSYLEHRRCELLPKKQKTPNHIMAPSTENRYKLGYTKAVLDVLQLRTAATDAPQLLPHLKTDSKILDVGCGPGSITLDFAKLAAEGSVVGVDISAESIAVARQRIDDYRAQHAAQKLADTTFRQMNVLEGLPFADKTFDIVYAGQVFVHLLVGLDGRERAMAVMREMHRVLKPGGAVATKDVTAYHWLPRSHTEGREEVFLRIRKLAYGFAVPPGGEMPSVVAAAGFDPATMTISASTRVISGREEKSYFANMILTRLNAADTRENLSKNGSTVKELEEAKATLEAWLKDDLAWQAGLHTQVLAFK